MLLSVENASSNKQNSRSNGGRGGAKKKSGGGVSTKGKGEDDKKSAGVTKAVQKKIDAWWEQNSDALIKRTVEESGWEEVDANTVKAYKQFLQVKREMQDWENKLLPCTPVVLMIEAHELSDDYQADMKLLCGHDFGGKELIVCEKEDDYDREKATFEAVKRTFGSEFDEKLWNITSVSILGVGDDGIKWEPRSTHPTSIVQLIQRSNPLVSAFEEYVNANSGDPVDPETIASATFLNYRTHEVINPNDTALGLRWAPFTDVMFGLCNDEILIEVKKRGSDSSPFHLFCAANQTEPMTKALNDLVNDDGDETDYVYMFKGKRLYGFETPMSLQMKHFDIIDAIPVQDFKYKRCVCCNNADRHNV